MNIEHPSRAVALRIKVGQTGKDTKVWIDGEDISHKIRAYTLESSVDSFSTIFLDYVCVEGEINGEVFVHHRCPLADTEGEEE